MAELILVKWNDAWADATAVVTLKDALESHKPEVIETLGWLLVSDAEGISLANEICSDGSFRGRSFIPRGMVVKVTPFNLTKRRKKHEKAPDRSPDIDPPGC